MRGAVKKILALTAVLLVVLGLFGFSLFQIDASKEDLRVLMSTELGSASAYTPKTYQAYIFALSCAEEVETDWLATHSSIESAYSSLRESIDQLRLRPNKSSLQSELNNVDALNKSLYIPVSLTPLFEAIDKARIVLLDENAVEEEVNEIQKELKSSRNGLIEKPDKAGLTADYEAACAIDRSLYLSASCEALNEAAENASAVLENENATKTTVEDAIARIANGISRLVLKPDKTALKTLLEQAASYSEEKYTTASYNEFKKALAGAESIYNYDEATEDGVSKAEETLQAAIKGLVVSTKGVYLIDVSFYRRSTNHVGNSWSYGAFLNGEQFRTTKVTMRNGSSISIYCKVVENDKIPDVGSGYIYLSMKDGAERTILIYVRENRGRYSGNVATWEVTATATLIERV